MYEQIQNFLNECIKRGWKPFGQPYANAENRLLYNETENKVKFTTSDVCYGRLYSYHDLFSVESGLMEFVKWKEDGGNQYILCSSEYRSSNEIAPMSDKYYTGAKEYRYMIMSIMTVEQKIQYFLDNALLPEHNLGKK